MWALISVYDKAGLDLFAKRLIQIGFQILSTGNTAKFLKDHGISVQEVSDYTGFPEIFGGRVKTLHPKIHAGILAPSSPESLQLLKDLKIEAIDLVVVNLYPFERQPTLENIDIGGPTLLRAAAKNHERVTVVTDVGDYDRVAKAFERGEVPQELRKELAAKVFARTAAYETAIAHYFGGGKLRYGENPHQRAWFQPGLSLWKEPLQGKELSYNNILDADAAWWLIREFREEPFACAIIKHTNPCGMALSSQSLKEAFEKSLACDATSAFGGIVAFNREVDGKTVEAMHSLFFEIVLAPGFSKEALELLASKKNLRVLETKETEGPVQMIRSAGGGQLVQDIDRQMEVSPTFQTKTKRKPTEKEGRALPFAWKVCKHVKSNAIVFAHEDRIVAVGAGQVSRVDAVKVAVIKAKSSLKGTVVASDGFFPFADNIEEIAKTGATAIVQPGGSIRDPEVIQAADNYRLAMVFTGVRHFRH